MVLISFILIVNIFIPYALGFFPGNRKVFLAEDIFPEKYPLPDWNADNAANNLSFLAAWESAKVCEVIQRFRVNSQCVTTFIGDRQITDIRVWPARQFFRLSKIAI